MKTSNDFVVLVYGAGSSVGEAVVRELTGRGATVILHDIHNPARAMEVAKSIGANGRAIDASDLSFDGVGLCEGLEEIKIRYGRLDALVNLFTPHAKMTAEEMHSHVCSMYERSLSAGTLMAEANTGGIVVNQFFLASLFSDTPLGNHMATIRGAITGATRNLCIRLGKMGVRVAGLLVGLLDTPETKALASERVLKSNTPLGRWIEPVDVGKSIAFLVFESAYISGQMLIMDGGLTAGTNGT